MAVERSTGSKPKGPTTEQGHPAALIDQGELLRTWASFLDDREYVPDLQWPTSIQIFSRMQSDAQLRGLQLARDLPIRRFRWEIDPREAQDEVVEHTAESRNLPIRGREERPQNRYRFNHDRHLAHALRAPSFGHNYFEELYEYRPETGRLHLRKLGTRPPRTIANFLLAPNGDLAAIEQTMFVGSILGGSIPGQGVKLARDRLLSYVWEPEDDADWVGRSMLKACFRNWLIKDELLRVDAVKHARNSMGIPWFEVTNETAPSVVQDLGKIAAQIRAGEYSGGAGEGRLRIAGVEGMLPDTIGSVRYHDEQMAKAFLSLLFNLGGNVEFGSRALGDTFADWYTESQGAVADWYCEETQAQVDREVAANWGPDEPTPAVAYTRIESTKIAIADLALAVKEGLVAVDDEVRSWFAQREGLPAPKAGAAPTPPAPAKESPEPLLAPPEEDA